MRGPISIVLLLALVSSAGVAQTSFGPGSVEVQELRALYARSGLAFPTASFPVFREDLRRFALALLDRSPDEAVAERAGELAERFQARSEPAVAAEGQAFYQQFIGIPGGSLGFPELFRLEEPLARVGLSLQVDDSLLLSIQDVTQKLYRFGLESNNFPPAVPGNPFARENDSIREGYLRVVVGPLDVVFGRQPVHLGPADDSSLAVSSRIPFLDAARARMTVGPLTMTWLVSTLENRWAFEDGVLAAGPGYDFGITLILYNIHYFEWDAGPLRAGIGAQYQISRYYNAIQLGDLFPVFSWHNGDIGPNNMALIGDLEWVPVRGLRLFAQAGLDDVRSFMGVADSPVPTIDAEIAGISYSSVPASRWSLSIGLTGGHTHYLWGNYGYQYTDDYYLSRAIFRMDLRSLPLTSPYGPGASWATLEGRLLAPDGVADAGLALTYALTNPQADLHAAAYEESSALASAPLTAQFSGSIDLAYRLNSHLTLRLRPQVLVSQAASWLALGFGVDARF